MRSLIFIFVVGFVAICSMVTIQGQIFVYEKETGFLAASFFFPTVTSSDLKQKFSGYPKTGQVKILIVPGHEPNYGGAEYGSLKERHMNVELSLLLADLLRKHPQYEVTLARDTDGWNPSLKAYFDNNWYEIQRWTERRKLEMRGYINNGQIEVPEPAVYHNDAPSEVATRLYGINKWSKERDFDILLHVHFNDYPRASMNSSGKYYGYSIYIPDKQYPNAIATRELSQNIYDSLKTNYSPSNFPGERAGLIESQDLIAVGSNNSLDAVSFLIEYGYIYRFADKTMRTNTIKKMAELTAKGVNEFFSVDSDLATSTSTPHN